MPPPLPVPVSNAVAAYGEPSYGPPGSVTVTLDVPLAIQNVAGRSGPAL